MRYIFVILIVLIGCTTHSYRFDTNQQVKVGDRTGEIISKRIYGYKNSNEIATEYEVMFFDGKDYKCKWISEKELTNEFY